MSYLRLLPIFSLLFALSGRTADAARGPVPVLRPEGPGDAQPATSYKLLLPIVSNRFTPGYESPFGVVLYTTIDNDAGQAKMVTAGAHWLTTDLIWADVEPTPPVGSVHTYTWSSLDQDAANAQDQGNEIYVLINHNPSWASAYPSGPVTTTANLVAFATAAVERYDGDGVNDAPGHPVINYWSFYAEPDNGAKWAALAGKGYFGHNATGYANLLMAAAPAMHAANPHAKVLIGGLAYDSFEPGGPFVRSFLGDVLDVMGGAGAANYIDAIAFHYYPINLSEWPSIREKGLEIRGIMNAHNVGQLELIVPEMGFWSDSGSHSSEQDQAQTLVQMYVKGLTIGISHLDWFAVFDDGTGMETHGLFFNHNLNQPKQSYTAYKTMAATLFGFDYNRTFSVSGGEGYVFRSHDGHEVIVAWATSGSATAHLPGSCWRKTDLLGGSPTIIGDGSGSDADGSHNGQVGVALAHNRPVYIAVCD